MTVVLVENKDSNLVSKCDDQIEVKILGGRLWLKFLGRRTFVAITPPFSLPVVVSSIDITEIESESGLGAVTLIGCSLGFVVTIVILKVFFLE